MLRVLRNLLRRPPIRMGRVDNRAIRTTPIRNAQFVSFMSDQGLRRGGHPDRHDARLQRQKLLKGASMLAAIGASAWVVIESAHALSMF